MPETSIIVIQSIVKVHSYMGNKFKWSKLIQEHALHCSWNLGLTLSNKINGKSLTVQVEKQIKNINHSELLLLFYFFLFFHRHKADSLQHLK